MLLIPTFPAVDCYPMIYACLAERASLAVHVKCILLGNDNSTLRSRELLKRDNRAKAIPGYPQSVIQSVTSLC
jgi:hypothetical protein